MMTETVVTVDAPRANVGANNNATKPTNDTNQQGTTTTTQASPLAWIKINTEYFKTLPGMLKIAQVLLAIICMAFASPAYHGSTHFFLFVVTSSFIATIIWIFVYFLGVREALNLPINWILTELINTGLFAILYILGSILQLVASTPSSHHKGANITAGIFGLFNTLAYAAGAYLLYIEWKSNQGQ